MEDKLQKMHGCKSKEALDQFLDTAFDFRWSDAFGSWKLLKKYVSMQDEAIAILFNIAAVLTQQAVQIDGQGVEGLRDTARKFQAGHVLHICRLDFQRVSTGVFRTGICKQYSGAPCFNHRLSPQ